MSAIVVSTVGPAIGSIAGAVIGADASRHASNQAKDSADAANQIAQQQQDIANEQWQRYKDLYQPLENSVVADAQGYDTPAAYARAAGDASATVSDQFSKARDQLSRTPGLDPSSASYQASMIGLNNAQAATDATAQNLARKNVADTAFTRKTAAVGLGKGLDSTAAAGLNSAATQLTQQANNQQNLANNQAGSAGALVGGLANVATNFATNYLKQPTQPSIYQPQITPPAATPVQTTEPTYNPAWNYA